MSDPIIKIQNMNKWFGDFQVLKNINLELKKNNKVVIATEGLLDNKDFEFILHSKLASEFPGVNYNNKVSIMEIPKGFDDYASKINNLLSNKKLNRHYGYENKNFATKNYDFKNTYSLLPNSLLQIINN